MKSVRKIVFDLSKVEESSLLSVGVYKITNKVNGEFYIAECDKYFNMWRGYTSELTKKKSKQLIKDKYEFEIL